MSFLDSAHRNDLSHARPQFVVASFSLALFSSALLIFMVQPMFAKMALPRLGGSAAVWSLSLVFFQGMLLLGYGYAHCLVRAFNLRLGVAVHALVMAIATVSLPIGISEIWTHPPEQGQSLWLLSLFAACVGLPFFAISANAPLLQFWFSRSGHGGAHDPYFLYGASNVGSFAGLLAYPLAVEPFMALHPQSQGWSLAYVLLIAMVAGCGWLAASSVPASANAGSQTAAPAAAGWADRIRWIALSFVPSGLLVGTTAHLATDIVSAPFMWVVPLALFLLTFVITFQRKPIVTHAFVMRWLGLLIAPICLFVLSPATNLWLVPLHLLAVFALMMACHGELVRIRPDAGRLTEFYFLMSLGGVLGGIFASIAAPAIFNSIVEYPLLIVAGFAVTGIVRQRGKTTDWRVIAAFMSIPAVLILLWATDDADIATKHTVMLIWLLAALGALLVFSDRPAAQALVLLSVFFVYQSVSKIPSAIEKSRSFYGVLSVYPLEDGRINLLAHGTTEHGTQVRKDANGLRPAVPPEPQSYYYPNGPFGSVIRHLREGGTGLGHVAIIGLGTGSMACYAMPGESWQFFEIDPEVVRIARDTGHFTFLRDCAPNGDIVIGDGRLRMAQQPDSSYDMIVLDAFSSDSVPAHLLTVEALDLYLSKLKPGGVIIFHISNRFMELQSVVEAAARSRGLSAYYNALDLKFWIPDKSRFDLRPHLAVVARTPADLRGLTTDPAWHTSDVYHPTAFWTDDYSNVLGAIWRKYVGPGKPQPGPAIKH